MADKEIGSLTAASSLDGTELIHAVQSGNSRKATASQVRDYILIDEDDMSSNSAIKAPTQQSVKAYVDGAGVWKGVETQTVTSVSDVEFTGLSAYRMLRLSFVVIPATDNVYLNMVFGNGGTYDEGANEYTWIFTYSNAFGIGKENNDNDTKIALFSNVGNAATEGCSGNIIISEFNTSSYAQMAGTGLSQFASDSIKAGVTFAGAQKLAESKDCIRISFASGNIASGYFILEGVAG